MKKISLGIFIILLCATSCSSQNWYAVSSRDPAAVLNEEQLRSKSHRFQTSWGEMAIEIAAINSDKKIPVKLELINLKDNELIYKREFLGFISGNQTRINTLNQFEDKTLINEDDESIWKPLDNKYIPTSPLETNVIAGESIIRKGYFIRDTILIDSTELKKHDLLSVIISAELVKGTEDVRVDFEAK